MITTIILNLVYSVLWLLTRLLLVLPDVSINSGFGSAVAQVGSYIGPLDNFLPIDTILTILGLILTIEIGLASYKIIMWVIRRIPTQS